jgi:hypothetical protein
MHHHGRVRRGSGAEIEAKNTVEKVVVLNLALYQKIETYIRRIETVRPHSQFLHSCVWVRFTYCHDRSYLESLRIFLYSIA